MSKGKLIVIDGTDGSGKATQTKLLLQQLRKKRISAEALDFPQYETLFGKLVARYLKKEFGALDPYVASVLYAANRLEFRDKIISWLKQGKNVVLNRYTSSNQIHQAAHIDSKAERKRFVDWIGQMEYKIMGLPKPNLVVFLNVTPEIAYKLIENKDKKTRKYIQGAKRDWLESDLEYQRRAVKQSTEVLNRSYKWTKIDCVQHEVLLKKEEIAQMVWHEVSKLLRLKK